MSEQQLRRESLQRWRALGVFGSPAYQSHLQLVAMLRAQRQPLLARYFSRPQVAPDKQLLSFSTELQGPVLQRHQLSGEAFAAAKAEVAKVHAALNDFIATLQRDGKGSVAGAAVQGAGAGASAASFASLLEQARRVPAGEDFLYFVDGQPVVAYWAFEDAQLGSVDPTAPEWWADAAPAAAVAAPVQPAPPAAIEPAAPAVEASPVARPSWWQRLGWLRWLLLLLLALALAGALKSCWPTASPPTSPITQGKDVGAALEIPPGALERGDLSFLQGPWQLGEKRLSVYVDKPSNVVGSYRMVLNFDKAGGGQVHGVERMSRNKPAPDCKGGLKARTDGRKLYFETADCTEPGRDNINGSRYECERGSDGRTHCYVLNRDGHRWEAPLRRLQ